MNKDFRLAVNFPDHPKTKKLIRAFGSQGYEAAFCFLRLLGFAAQSKCTGELTNMTIEDIEIAADWRGEPGKLVEALLEVKFLDTGEEGYSIHDWAVHNRYAAHAQERSEIAKKGAETKWAKRKKMLNSAESNAVSIKEQCSSHETAMLRKR